MPRRRLLATLVLGVALASAACGDPPDKEMQQAQGAIDAAKAAGADQYAHEEFAAAQDALKRANDAVAQRDYRQALNYALDARERAQNAAKQAVDGKASAKNDAQRALADARNVLNDLHTRLKAAEAAHLSARVLVEPKRAVASADDAVQKARTAFDRGEYAEAIAALEGKAAKLRAIERDLEAAMAPASRRRH